MKTKFNGFLTLLLAFVVQITFAQEQTVSGTVVDENNIPLPGATVLIKGTSTGTSTDFDGKYSINANNGDTLSFSYVGYATQDIAVSSNSINVTLQPDNSLEEVVVTAIGIKRKPDEITTANQVVKADELNQAANPNAVQALSGKVSGLQINTTSSGLTQNNQITLRGPRSISGGNGALIVIDNVVSSTEVFQTMDPNTIESVNVIKGANGAALYGELGKSGVIIVTTKKGVKGSDKFTVDISSSATFEEVAFLPETQDRFGQGWGGNIETVDQSSWGVPYNGALIPVGTPDANGDYRFFEYSHIEDNILPFFQTGLNLQNSISIAGGSMESGYVNLSYLRQDVDGILPTTKLLKNNFSLTTGKKIGKLTAQAIARYTEEKTDDINNVDENGFGSSIYSQLSQIAGNIPIEAFDSGDNADHWTVYGTSPYWTLKNDRLDGRRRIVDLTGSLTYEFNDNINAVFRANVRNTQDSDVTRRNGFVDDVILVAGNNRTIRSYYKTDIDTDRIVTNDFLVNFDYNLTEDITFKSNVGVSTWDRRYSRLISSGLDLVIPGFFHLSNLGTVPVAQEANLRHRRAGVFAQVDLGYKDYLFLNATGRNDWNSVLPESNRSFFYPSVGLAFIPTKAFPEIKSKAFHKAKLSASYVKVGTADALAAHQLSTVAINDTFYPSSGNVSLIGQNSVVDPNIENEFINSFEANVNLEFLNIKGPRITLDASASLSRNTNQILETSSSFATGFGNAVVNVGETKSNAFEVDLGFTPVKTEDFELNGRVGFSTFKTTVEKVSDESDRVRVDGRTSTIGTYAIEGEEFPMLLGNGYVRDDQGQVVIDTNGNPISQSELQVMGQTTPDYILNFSVNARYKNFRFAANADYRTGHVFHSGIKRSLASVGKTIETTRNDRLPFIYPNSTVQGTNGAPNTTVETAGGNPLIHPYNFAYLYYQNSYMSFDENFITDATAFKLREVSLSYDLPVKFVQQLKLSKFNVGVSARNLLTILPSSNKDYTDPEFAGRFGQAGFQRTPPTRHYSVRVNFAF
ncbi:SusC/RagA family TonB-linked outer membrane protein [Pseudofulvibacter geojedonensis]|uniref:SusC/RagA family TonB-linked outer membrane protein n=1 Tax=Pseudofulvibacter geojedonensis TaxID=1123758 RepID=A0ABW3I4X3_9FLAO